MPLERFREVLEQVPGVRRIVLHGMGEPLLHRRVHEMVALAVARGAHVLFNTNGVLLTRAVAGRLVDAGLHELRVSVDMPDPGLYREVRSGGNLGRVYRNVEGLITLRDARGAAVPAVSFWMTEGRSRLRYLAALVRDAARLGVREVYVQRLILMGRGDAVEGEAVFGRRTDADRAHLAEADRVARELGVSLWGSGDRSAADEGAGALRPWQECRRPYAAAYVTANGNLLPCCLTPFTAAGRAGDFVLGNVFETRFATLWSGPAYGELRKQFASESPPECCRLCGTRWSL
jgi:MoaA/NifB/PqqE/SkfB family radical SAM enzyme